MDYSNAIHQYVHNQSGGAVTYPNGGTWLSAYCLYLGITEPTGGSWLIALCNNFGITEPLNGSWVIALANYYNITSPAPYGTWWMALANASGAPTPFVWNLNTNNWEVESRTWSLT